MESLEAVRAEIAQLKEEAAQAKQDDDRVLYSALQQRLAALQAKEERLAAQGVPRQCRKISLWDQTESQRGWPSNGCGRSH